MTVMLVLISIFACAPSIVQVELFVCFLAWSDICVFLQCECRL